jgi:hypothetical protein
VNELILQLKTLGITPSLPTEDDGAVSDSWEDIEESDDEDGDIEMQ